MSTMENHGKAAWIFHYTLLKWCFVLTVVGSGCASWWLMVTSAGLVLFGAGWCWLVLAGDGWLFLQLSIVACKNQLSTAAWTTINHQQPTTGWTIMSWSPPSTVAWTTINRQQLAEQQSPITWTTLNQQQLAGQQSSINWRTLNHQQLVHWFNNHQQDLAWTAAVAGRRRSWVGVFAPRRKARLWIRVEVIIGCPWMNPWHPGWTNGL